MRSIDNDGEGGVIALMTLLRVKKHQRSIIVAVEEIHFLQSLGFS